MNFKTLMILCLAYASPALALERCTAIDQSCILGNNTPNIILDINKQDNYASVIIKDRSLSQKTLVPYRLKAGLQEKFRILEADKYLMTEISSPTSINIRENNQLVHQSTYINSDGGIHLSAGNWFGCHDYFVKARGDITFSAPTLGGQAFITTTGTVKFKFPEGANHWIESIEWQPSETFLPANTCYFEGNFNFSPLAQEGQLLIYGTERVTFRMKKTQ